MTKDQLRIQMKGQRSELSEALRSTFDHDIRQRLFESEYYKGCIRLFIFVSFGSELDTKTIISKALQDRKEVYVPRVENRNMEFYQIFSLEGLIPSKFGVPEPPITEALRYPGKKNEYHSLDQLMLLPGLAFDLQGNRIGYGAGFYDRFLNAHHQEEFVKVALAYEFQLIEQIETQVHDVRVETIITPTQIYTCT